MVDIAIERETLALGPGREVADDMVSRHQGGVPGQHDGIPFGDGRLDGGFEPGDDGGAVVQPGGGLSPGRLGLLEFVLQRPSGRPSGLRLGRGLVAYPVAFAPRHFGVGDVLCQPGPFGIPFSRDHLELAPEPTEFGRGATLALAGRLQLVVKLGDEPFKLLPHRATVDAERPLPAPRPEFSDAPQGAVNQTDRISHHTVP